MTQTTNPNLLGERLALFRKLNGLTLEQVAQRSALTKSYLSKLERGLSSPTISTVFKLARALDVSADKLIGETAPDDGIVVVKANERVPFSPSPEREGYTYEAIATQRTDKSMVPFMMSPPFSIDEAQRLVSHSGEELIFVVSGKLEVVFEDRVVRLDKGDSLYFNAALPHRSRSIGKIAAQALVVVSDPAKRKAEGLPRGQSSGGA